MATIRVNKPQSYQVMDITHLYDNAISCAAKGLMCLLISTNGEFDLTTNSLCQFTKENESDIMLLIDELKNAGYLKEYQDNVGEFLPPDFQIDI